MDHMDRVDKLVEDIRCISAEMKKGRIRSLSNLRSLIVDLDLVGLSEKVDGHVLAVLYLLKRLINDVFTNLGTDASFEFPKSSSSGFTKKLGYFISCALSNNEDEKGGEALNSLFEAIGEYYSIILRCTDEFEKYV